MGCLFGYCGLRMEGLLEAMAQTLKHRCKRGWEQAGLVMADNRVFEIGHGIAPWSRTTEPHLFGPTDRGAVLGYSGVLFHGAARASHQGKGSILALLDDPEVDPAEVLEGLDGAFVMAHATGQEVYLVRDPAGIKVLYWTLHKDRLLFASEIKALFADPTTPRRLRLAALPEYFTFSFVPGTGTMLEGVQELQPGTILKFARGKCEILRHFLFERHEYDERIPSRVEDFSVRVRSALEQSVRDCCQASDGPPAVFVSGGIDSSAVMAVAANQFPGVPLKTFSVHFGDNYANENEFVRMMVDRYQSDHTWIEIRPAGFLDRMRQIIWSLDDPIGDPITVPNYLMADTASQVCSVVLNGEGGDPCFGGPKNIPMILTEIYGPGDTIAPDEWIERNYLLSFKKCFSDLKQLLDPAVLKESGGEDALISLVRPFFRAELPQDFLNKLMATNIRLKGANLILVKVDKMSSANGLLALPPLFTKRIIETSMMCPPHLKLEGNVEKAVLKRAVEDIVPRPIVERPKSGMMVPVKFWFREDMRDYAKRVLSKRSLKRVGLFNVDYVRRLLNYQVSDIHGFRYGTKLWMMITFMIWYEQTIESSPVQLAYSDESRSRGLWGKLARRRNL